jgi:hypothetical protein
MLGAGEGLFIAGGTTAVLKAGSGGASNFLHFFLTPAGDLDRAVETAPATVTELYRTAAPIPDLKSGIPRLIGNPTESLAKARDRDSAA